MTTRDYIAADAWIFLLGFTYEAGVIQQSPRMLLHNPGEGELLMIAEHIGVDGCEHLRGRDLAMAVIRHELVSLFEAGLTELNADMTIYEANSLIGQDGRMLLLRHFRLPKFCRVAEQQVEAIICRFEEIKKFHKNATIHKHAEGLSASPWP